MLIYSSFWHWFFVKLVMIFNIPESSKFHFEVIMTTWFIIDLIIYDHKIALWLTYIDFDFSIGSSPVVNECDGEYTHDSRKNILVWTLPIIDASNNSGSLEFSATALPGDFFPLQVNFVSKNSYADLMVRWDFVSVAPSKDSLLFPFLLYSCL